MNIENFRSVVQEDIEASPRNWNQSLWHWGTTHCGTTHCLAGFAQLRLTGKADNSTTRRDARMFFEMSMPDADYFFKPTRTLADFRAALIIDEEGYDQDGYDRDGFDRDGFDRAGVHRDGYHRDGYDRNGFHRNRLGRVGYDRHGFNQYGFDVYRFDREGFDHDGLDRNFKPRLPKGANNPTQ